jgi:hypothetical protein
MKPEILPGEEEEKNLVAGGISGLINEYAEIAGRFDSHPRVDSSPPVRSRPQK